ncbi:hypothetical protein MMC20_006199 [Loxospora ochrophaea]|nr:hypothetical protein [Loxospora ochrophaea]
MPSGGRAPRPPASQAGYGSESDGESRPRRQAPGSRSAQPTRRRRQQNNDEDDYDSQEPITPVSRSSTRDRRGGSVSILEEEDEHLRRAIEASSREANSPAPRRNLGPSDDEDDEDFLKALKISQQAHEQEERDRVRREDKLAEKESQMLAQVRREQTQDAEAREREMRKRANVEQAELDEILRESVEEARRLERRRTEEQEQLEQRMASFGNGSHEEQRPRRANSTTATSTDRPGRRPRPQVVPISTSIASPNSNPPSYGSSLASSPKQMLPSRSIPRSVPDIPRRRATNPSSSFRTDNILSPSPLRSGIQRSNSSASPTFPTPQTPCSTRSHTTTSSPLNPNTRLATPRTSSSSSPSSPHPQPRRPRNPPPNNDTLSENPAQLSAAMAASRSQAIMGQLQHIDESDPRFFELLSALDSNDGAGAPKPNPEDGLEDPPPGYDAIDGDRVIDHFKYTTTNEEGHEPGNRRRLTKDILRTMERARKAAAEAEAQREAEARAEAEAATSFSFPSASTSVAAAAAATAPQSPAAAPTLDVALSLQETLLRPRLEAGEVAQQPPQALVQPEGEAQRLAQAERDRWSEPFSRVPRREESRRGGERRERRSGL